MSENRIYTQSPLDLDLEVTLTGDAARHVGRVLRARPGDEIILFDDRGGEYRAVIVSVAKSATVVRTCAFDDRNIESPLPVHLLQCVSRGERMDLVVQKATELGVQRITPLLSEFTVVRLDAERARKRRLHWQKVAISACEQCGRNRLPEIDLPVSLVDWLGAQYETQQPRSMHLALSPGAPRSLSETVLPGQPVTVLVGPEGGLSDTERDRLVLTGFQEVSLGPRILRTETAAIATLSVLQALAGDFA